MPEAAVVDGHEPVGRVMEPAVRQAVLRLVCHQLSQAGFTHVDDPAVLDDLESLAHSLLHGLAFLSQELARAARRSRPNVLDAAAACEDQGISISALRATLDSSPDADVTHLALLPVAPSNRPVDPASSFLDQGPEADGDKPGKAKKRRKLSARVVGGPSHLPPLPPVHTWRRTIVRAPPKADGGDAAGPAPPGQTSSRKSDPAKASDPNDPASLPLLDRRIRNTRMVEGSLRNLIKSTTAPTTNDPQPAPPTALTIRLPAAGSSSEQGPPPSKRQRGEASRLNYASTWYSLSDPAHEPKKALRPATRRLRWAVA